MTQDANSNAAPANEGAGTEGKHPLDAIFHPRAVALVGVPSGESQGASLGFFTSLLEQGFHERLNHGLYPVNPKADEIRGFKAYHSLLETPDPVDHVISLIPARAVPMLVEQAIQKKVRSIHFFTAGFSETGDEEMANLERTMVEKLTAAGIRVLGPNCMGLYVPYEGLAFMNQFPKEPGNVMFVSQSGANAGDVVRGLGNRGVRFSKVISFGNGSDLRAHHFFDYAITDDETDLVTSYIEGVQDGPKFLTALKALARVKPVILLKGGLTGAGALMERSDSEVEAMVAVNLLGVVHGTRAALSTMLPRNHGRILNVASLAGWGPVPNIALYSATKNAVRAFSVAADAEIGSDSVRIQCLLPDGIATPMVDVSDPRHVMSFTGKRLLDPNEVALAALELLSGNRPVASVPHRRGAVVRVLSLFPSAARPLKARIESRARSNQQRAISDMADPASVARPNESEKRPSG